MSLYSCLGPAGKMSYPMIKRLVIEGNKGAAGWASAGGIWVGFGEVGLFGG